MNTLFFSDLKTYLMDKRKSEHEKGNGDHLYIDGSLFAIIAKLERDGYRFSEEHVDPETCVEDFDDLSLLSENRKRAVLSMISDTDKLTVRRRDDMWFYIVHVAHYTDGDHDVYVAILC